MNPFQKKNEPPQENTFKPKKSDFQIGLEVQCKYMALKEDCRILQCAIMNFINGVDVVLPEFHQSNDVPAQCYHILRKELLKNNNKTSKKQ